MVWIEEQGKPMIARVASIVLFLGALAPGLAQGMGTGSDTSPAAVKDPDIVAAEAAIQAKDFKAAVPLLERAIAKNQRNADAHNLLGFSQRNLGDNDKARSAYANALEIEPTHKGANEYLGQLYLIINDLPKAEEQLAKLAKICVFGCAEHRELKRAVDAFKAKRPRT